MPLILPGNVASATASTGYDVDNSCRFNDDDSPQLQKGMSAGNPDVWTFSTWVKRCSLKGAIGQTLFAAEVDGNNGTWILFDQYEKLRVGNLVSGSWQGLYQTNRLWRDLSAWYHVVVLWNTASGTAGERIRLWVNGIEETAFSTETNPDQNQNSWANQTDTTAYFRHGYNAGYGVYSDFYQAETVFIDGTVYAASDFGEFDEDSPTIWKPKDVSGLTFGTNGYYLDFKDSANLGNDANGGTDFTETNLAAIDQATDTPTNNFATANPLSGNAEAFAQGNLHITDRAATDASYGACSTIGLIKGKWFVEYKCVAAGSAMWVGLLIAGGEMSIAGDFYSSTGTLLYRNNATKQVYPASATSYGDSWTDDDIIGMAVDMDNLDVYFYKNGTIQNSGTAAFTSSDFTTGTFYFPMQAGYNTGVAEYNFGGCNVSAISSGNADANGYGNFEYAVPSGYYAICTKNLAEFGG